MKNICNIHELLNESFDSILELHEEIINLPHEVVRIFEEVDSIDLVVLTEDANFLLRIENNYSILDDIQDFKVIEILDL